MCKLVYKTRKPRKGFVFMESEMVHKYNNFDKYKNAPSQETQKQAMDLVNDVMEKLLKDLEKLGYDPTKVSFSIGYEQNF